MNSEFRTLGDGGPAVFPIALGSEALVHGDGIRVIHEAIERGVNLIDTGDFYGAGGDELLIGKALEGRRDRVKLSVKTGALRSPDGAFIGLDARPAAMKNFITYSLKRLGVDHIDIYRPARLDPAVPIEDTVGAVADLVKAGYVRYIGLSEMGADTIRRAHQVHPIVDLQIEYSLFNRRPEQNLFPVLSEAGIGVTAYGVLAHGLLSGKAKPSDKSGPRAHLPWFHAENFEKNMKLVNALAAVAQEKGCSPAQLAIAWALSKWKDLVPVVGARTVAQLQDTLMALQVKLGADDVVRIEATVPPEQIAGTRYLPMLMKMLDSERP
ncbi:aldo/keto reductase [Myxococcus stipitatus]|uniref:aldo/keto reductase n=1 Tax=Myxococcus stipitatus TaxID=83455 RepID=UPI001F3B8A15|nr:aldo/keto reductase [Myxococcus stipitatus]MCE9673965.1 aldo/keto reductase [Myxococcus stipitatus]